MALISLGTINKKIFVAIFAGLYELFANIFLFSYLKISDYPCILGINAGLGLSLSLIPFLYLKLRDRKKHSFKSSLKISKTFISFDPNIEIAKKRKKKYYYILSIASLDFIQKFFSFFLLGHYIANFWVFNTCFFFIFSFLILKHKFYLHHFLSLSIISIIGIILNIINNYEERVSFLDVLLAMIGEIIYCLENVICKYVMQIKFFSPYEIGFYIGLFDLIFFSILLIIFTNIQVSNVGIMNHINDDYIDNFYIYLDNLDLKEGLLFIPLMFFRFFHIVFGFLIEDYFTPAHILLIIISGETSFIFTENYDWKIYLQILFFIIILFFLLIFTEIIELNIFGLQKNTQKNIRKRLEREESQYDSQINDVSSINSNNDDEQSKKSSNENSKIYLLSNNGNEYYL